MDWKYSGSTLSSGCEIWEIQDSLAIFYLCNMLPKKWIQEYEKLNFSRSTFALQEYNYVTTKLYFLFENCTNSDISIHLLQTGNIESNRETYLY